MSMRRHRGVTMVELVIVLAVVAVMMSVALPDLRQMIRSQQLKAAVGDLFGAIDLARTQAIARGRKVLLVPGDGADWNAGWVVFVDENGDRRPDGAEDVIMRHGALAPGIAVDAVFSGGAPYLAYNSMGRSCSAASSLAARWGTLSLTMGEQRRRIKINMLGRARICDPARDGASCSGADP